MVDVSVCFMSYFRDGCGECFGLLWINDREPKMPVWEKHTEKVLPSLVKHAIKNTFVFISTKHSEKKSDSLVELYKCVYTRFSRGKTSWSITFRQLLSLDKEVGADNSSIIETESLHSNNTLFSQFPLKYAGGWNIQPCTSQYYSYVLDLHLCAAAGTFSFALQTLLTLISFPSFHAWVNSEATVYLSL